MMAHNRILDQSKLCFVSRLHRILSDDTICHRRASFAEGNVSIAANGVCRGEGGERSDQLRSESVIKCVYPPIDLL